MHGLCIIKIMDIVCNRSSPLNFHDAATRRVSPVSSFRPVASQRRRPRRGRRSKSLHPPASECERVVPPYSPPVGYDDATTPPRTRMTSRHPCLATTTTMTATTAGAASSRRTTRTPSRGGTTTAGRPSRGRSPSPGLLTSRWRRSGKRRRRGAVRRRAWRFARMC